MKKTKRYVRKGGFGQNPIPVGQCPPAKPGDKIRIVPEKEKTNNENS